MMAFRRSGKISIRLRSYAAVRRYINRVYSPPCRIDKDKMRGFLQDIWATPANGFAEVDPIEDPENPFLLQSEGFEEMEEFMLSEKNISAVIMPRSDIGGVGPDGVNNRILKIAEKQGIRFVKNMGDASHVEK
jgi:hypothetical protein